MVKTLANKITREIQAPHACKVFISDSASSDGKEVSETYDIIHMVVSRMPNKVAFAKFIIEDGEVSKQDFEISNESDFEPGKFITVHMGDVNDAEPVFKGIIVRHSVRIRKNKNPYLTIDCRDVAVKMTTQCKSRYFSEKAKDKEAFEEILKDYKDLDGEFSATEIQHEGLVQYDSTDWDFVVKRANSAGHLIYTDSGVLKSVVPTVGATAEYTLEYGDEVLEFEAETDWKGQFKENNINTWDSSKQELIDESVKDTGDSKIETPGNLSFKKLAKIGNSNGLTINYPGPLIAQEAKTYAKAELIKSRLARIVGRVSYEEATPVPVGATIELKGVGDRFNGLTYVTGVRYEFANNVWTTNLQFGLDRNWFEQYMDATSVSGPKIPEMSGLHIGIVTDVVDKEGEDRVRVRVPVIDEKGEGVWAKMVRPDAGEHRGMFHLPEKDDEVLVGFLNCDPRYPMVMGMLNSSAKPAPVEAKEKDNLKGYYSKEGSRIEFDDKNRTLKIQTLSSKESKNLKDLRSGEPELEKNNTIFIDDKKGTILIQDKNKNYIKFDKKEILIYGEKKITLQSKEVEIKADKKLTTNAGTASFESKMETKIKGTPINLNP